MQSVRDFAKVLTELERNRDLLRQMSENCKQRQQELSWKEKAKTMVEWYEKTIRNGANSDTGRHTKKDIHR